MTPMVPEPVVGQPRLAMIGVGRMGEAVLAGLLGAGWDPGAILAVEPHPEQAAHVRAAHGVHVVAEVEAAATADVIVVAVKPQDVAGVLDRLCGGLVPDSLVISLAAGVPLAVLASHLPAGTAIIRVMPNTPALVGQGMSVMSPGPACDDSDVEHARAILSSVGRVALVPESSQDAVTAVSGSGPAYVYYVVEAMVDAGVMLGLPRPLATELAVQTLVGSAAMLAGTNERAGVLRENVTSPGGTTAAALHVLDENAVKAGIARAMRACRDRSGELAARATSAG